MSLNSQVERVMNIVYYDYERALTVLHQFRDMKKDTAPSLLEQSSFLLVEPEAFDTSRFYVLRELTGSDKFYLIYQQMLAFAHSLVRFIVYDQCGCIQLYLGKGNRQIKIVADAEAIFDAYMDELKKREKIAEQFFELINQINQLAGVLSRQRFSFGQIKSLRKSNKVAEILEQLDLFEERLKNSRQDERGVQEVFAK